MDEVKVLCPQLDELMRFTEEMNITKCCLYSTNKGKLVKYKPKTDTEKAILAMTAMAKALGKEVVRLSYKMMTIANPAFSKLYNDFDKMIIKEQSMNIPELSIITAFCYTIVKCDILGTEGCDVDTFEDFCKKINEYVDTHFA